MLCTFLLEVWSACLVNRFFCLDLNISYVQPLLIPNVCFGFPPLFFLNFWSCGEFRGCTCVIPLRHREGWWGPLPGGHSNNRQDYYFVLFSMLVSWPGKTRHDKQYLTPCCYFSHLVYFNHINPCEGCVFARCFLDLETKWMKLGLHFFICFVLFDFICLNLPSVYQEAQSKIVWL